MPWRECLPGALWLACMSSANPFAKGDSTVPQGPFCHPLRRLFPSISRPRRHVKFLERLGLRQRGQVQSGTLGAAAAGEGEEGRGAAEAKWCAEESPPAAHPGSPRREGAKLAMLAAFPPGAP